MSTVLANCVMKSDPDFLIGKPENRSGHLAGVILGSTLGSSWQTEFLSRIAGNKKPAEAGSESSIERLDLRKVCACEECRRVFVSPAWWGSVEDWVNS